MCKPDYVVTENVERYLDNCVLDESRPNFFMYPYLHGDQYSPSAEFSEALSAVLSVGRPPYAEFRKKYYKNLEKKKQIEIHSNIYIAVADMPMKLNNQERSESDIETIENVKLVPRNIPAFIDNQLGIEIDSWLPPLQDIHGSVLTCRRDVVLFGPSIQIGLSGDWACESRKFGRQFVEMVGTNSYRNIFPGPKPNIEAVDGVIELDFRKILTEIEFINEPLFLATPLEPNNWGRWISSVIPRVRYFRRYGSGRKLFCYVKFNWQEKLLYRLGVLSDEVRFHDPGKTYICRDLMSVESSVANMTVSDMEKNFYFDIVGDARKGMTAEEGRGAKKIFISRKTLSAKNQSYRVLQNESELISTLERDGFSIVEPELLSFEEQVITYNEADTIVSLGGAANYNAVFCKPGARFMTIESSSEFLRPHCELLSSLGLRYGVVVGTQDASDATPVHKRWTVDIATVRNKIAELILGRGV